MKKVWICKDSRPIVTITGSHRNLSLFGAISLKGKQLFRIYERFNENTFYEFLKQIHYKFPRCYLFLDKAPQHYRSSKIRKYFEEHKDTLKPIFLPTASPEFMVLEECWNISKDDLTSINILHIIHRIQKEVRTVLQNHTFQSKYEQLSYQEYVRELNHAIRPEEMTTDMKLKILENIHVHYPPPTYRS